MKKIAHICTNRKNYRILQDRLLLLAQQGYEVNIISSSQGEDTDFFKKYGVMQYYVEMNESINIIDDIKSIVRMFLFLKKEKFDVIHTHQAKAGVIGRVAARFAGVPLIIHTTHGLPFYSGQNRMKYHIYKNLEILASKFCDKVCSQNKEDFNDLEKLIKKDKVIYEGNGVNCQVIDELNSLITEDDLRELKSKYSIPENEKILLMAARFEPVKNHLMLLESLKLLREKGYTDFCCILAGFGTLERLLQEKVKELGIESNVRFIGYQTNIYPWIKMADLVLLTSEKEGIPRIIMESMLFSKAIVATDVLGTRELVVDKQTGYLSAFGDASMFAKFITSLLENNELRAKFGKLGRTRILTCFSEGMVVKRMVDLYESNK